MSAQRTVICGGTGFLGRNLATALAKDPRREVIATHHERPPVPIDGVRWIKADLTLGTDVERALRDAQVVIQAAAVTSGARDIVERPYLHVTDNAVMNSLLLRAAYHAKVSHFLFLSCSIMYQSSDRPLTEADFDPAAPLHARYFGAGWTKLYIERMCEFFSGLGDTRFTVVRHSNVYGPWDKFDLATGHVFGATVRKVMSASDGKVVVWGKGEERRDLVYVDDLTAFVQAALERQTARYRIYNCGTGESVSVNDLVARIVKMSGRRLNVVNDLDRPSLDTRLSLDSSLAARELGWRPSVSLDEGISRTLAWYEGHLAGAA